MKTCPNLDTCISRPEELPKCIPNFNQCLVFQAQYECEHKPYCPDNIRKYSMKCVFGKDKCNVKKFYDRYGVSANEMFVGATR